MGGFCRRVGKGRAIQVHARLNPHPNPNSHPCHSSAPGTERSESAWSGRLDVEISAVRPVSAGVGSVSVVGCGAQGPGARGSTRLGVTAFLRRGEQRVAGPEWNRPQRNRCGVAWVRCVQWTADAKYQEFSSRTVRSLVRRIPPWCWRDDGVRVPRRVPATVPSRVRVRGQTRRSRE